MTLTSTRADPSVRPPQTGAPPAATLDVDGGDLRPARARLLLLTAMAAGAVLRLVNLNVFGGKAW